MSTWMTIEPRQAYETRTRFPRNSTRPVRQRVRGWKGRIAQQLDHESARWVTQDACVDHVHIKRGAARECAAKTARALNRAALAADVTDVT